MEIRVFNKFYYACIGSKRLPLQILRDTHKLREMEIWKVFQEKRNSIVYILKHYSVYLQTHCYLTANEKERKIKGYNNKRLID